MGDILLELKVFPAEGANTEELKKRIEENISIRGIREEPIAFGLKALVVTIVVPEEGGNAEEEKLKKLEGVGETETIRATKLL